MKKTIYQSLIVLLLIFIISCSSSPNLCGEWKSSTSDRKLTIIKNDDTYTVNISGLGFKGSFSGKYKNGKIDNGTGRTDEPTYNNKSDKIFWIGEEFTRIGNPN